MQTRIQHKKRFLSSHIGKVVKTGALLAAIGASLSVSSQSAQASPSGLIIMPSTDIYSKGTIHLDVDWVRFNGGTNAFFTTGDTDIITGGLTYGVGPDRDGLFGRTEVGFEYDIDSGARNRFENRFSVNAKTQLYNNDANGIRVSAGGTQIGNTNLFSNIAYITASKNFGKPGRVHLGYGRIFNKDQTRDILSVAGTVLQKNNANTFQLGYEYFFTPKLHGIVEYNYARVNGAFARNLLDSTGVSLIYYLNDRSDIQLAYVRRNRDNIFLPGRDSFYVGYDYNFGRRPASAEAAVSEGEARK